MTEKGIQTREDLKRVLTIYTIYCLCVTGKQQFGTVSNQLEVLFKHTATACGNERPKVTSRSNVKLTNQLTCAQCHTAREYETIVSDMPRIGHHNGNT